MIGSIFWSLLDDPRISVSPIAAVTGEHAEQEP